MTKKLVRVKVGFRGREKVKITVKIKYFPHYYEANSYIMYLNAALCYKKSIFGQTKCSFDET